MQSTTARQWSDSKIQKGRTLQRRFNQHPFEKIICNKSAGKKTDEFAMHSHMFIFYTYKRTYLQKYVLINIRIVSFFTSVEMSFMMLSNYARTSAYLHTLILSNYARVSIIGNMVYSFLQSIVNFVSWKLRRKCMSHFCQILISYIPCYSISWISREK